MATEHEIRARSRPLRHLRLSVLAREQLASRVRRPHGVDVEQVGEEVVGELTGALRQDAVGGAVKVGVEGAHAADEHRHLGRCQRQQLGFVDEELFGAGERPARAVAEVAEAVTLRVEVLEVGNVCVVLGSVDAADCEWYNDVVVTGGAGGLLDGGISA